MCTRTWKLSLERWKIGNVLFKQGHLREGRENAWFEGKQMPVSGQELETKEKN